MVKKKCVFQIQIRKKGNYFKYFKSRYFVQLKKNFSFLIYVNKNYV